MPLPFGLFFVRHSEKGKKKQAAPMALPAMFYLFIAHFFLFVLLPVYTFHSYSMERNSVKLPAILFV